MAGRLWLLTAAALTAVVCSGGACQAQSQGLEARVSRLERLMEGGGLVNILMRMDRLQEQVQRLQGELELQGHAVEELQSRQRQTLADLDRRVSELERTLRAPPPAPGGPPAEAAPSRPSAAVAIREQDVYEAALLLLREGKYPRAIDSFGEYLRAYPEGQYAANAQYWLGEAYYVNGDKEKALASFQRVVEVYGESSKASDALLKIGYIQDDIGRLPEARQTLETVIQKYPGTSAARLAESRLQRLKGGGG